MEKTFEALRDHTPQSKASSSLLITYADRATINLSIYYPPLILDQVAAARGRVGFPRHHFPWQILPTPAGMFPGRCNARSVAAYTSGAISPSTWMEASSLSDNSLTIQMLTFSRSPKYRWSWHFLTLITIAESYRGGQCYPVAVCCRQVFQDIKKRKHKRCNVTIQKSILLRKGVRTTLWTSIYLQLLRAIVRTGSWHYTGTGHACSC